MVKKVLVVNLFLLVLGLPLAAWAVNVPVKVYENGANNSPVAVSGVKLDAFGGYGFKARLSSGVTGSDGSCILNNLPVGKEVVIKLTKASYVTQYDVRSYSEADAENGAILWIVSETKVKVLYNNLGETLYVSKGQVYLEVNNELTGEGIEGVQFAVASGRVFDMGQGEYLIANAAGTSLKVGFQKAGYAFDIESVTIPLFPGAMTQYYVNVQTGGVVSKSGQAAVASGGSIQGRITQVSQPDVPISGVTVSFFFGLGGKARPDVVTDKNGLYEQVNFPGVPRVFRVEASKPGWLFRSRIATVLPGKETTINLL